MKIRFEDRAKEEIKAAAAWYEEQQENLGYKFLDCVEKALPIILDNPEMYQISYSDFRGCHLDPFPYTIFYAIEKVEIVIYSVFNNYQDPAKRP